MPFIPHRSDLSETSRRLLDDFEQSVREHELRGAQMPESYAEIDANYANDTQALVTWLYQLERTR